MDAEENQRDIESKCYRREIVYFLYRMKSKN